MISRFNMQYDHEEVEITLSICAFQTYLIDSGIDQRKFHRTSCRLGSADDLIQLRQIMLYNGKLGRFLLCFWQQVFDTQSEHEGVEIALPILQFQT